MRRSLILAFLGGFMLACLVMFWGGSAAAIAAPGEAAPGGPLVMLDEHDMRLTYVNAYRIHTTQEEVVMDLGFNMPDPNVSGAGAQPRMLFRVQDRVVLSYGNAKRLQAALATLVQRYEREFGEIKVPQQ